MSRPSSPPSRQDFDAVLAEYLHRTECGEDVSRATLLAEHPHLKDEINEFFAADTAFSELLDSISVEESLAFYQGVNQGSSIAEAAARASSISGSSAALSPEIEESLSASSKSEMAQEPAAPAWYGRHWLLPAAAGAVLLAVVGSWLLPERGENPPDPVRGPAERAPFVDPSVVWVPQGKATATITPQQRAAWEERPRQLLGHWLTAPPDGQVIDRSPFRHHGTLYGDLRWNEGLELDGQGNWVSLGNPSEMNFDGPITLAARIRLQKLGGFQYVIAHGYHFSPPAEVYLRLRDNRYEVGAWNGRDHAATHRVGREDVGRWVHLAGVFDGHRWRLYKNGREVAAAAAGLGAIPVGNGWAIGSCGAGNSRFFTGGIRDVRLYNYALSAEEIARLAD